MQKRRGGQIHAQLDGRIVENDAAGKAIELLCSKLHDRDMGARWHERRPLSNFTYRMLHEDTITITRLEGPPLSADLSSTGGQQEHS